MLLFPKKPKFFKSFSGKKITKDTINKTTRNKFANISLIANQSSKITNFQIEALRKVLRRLLKKKGQIFFRIFPNTPITKKANNVRLGRGKGATKHWSYIVQKNEVILEIRSFNDTLAKNILKLSQKKLTTKTFIYNRNLRWTL